MHQTRTATTDDAPMIRELLLQLGYITEAGLIARKLQRLYASANHTILISELEGVVTGFIAMHIIPQLGLPGDTAVISYLCVDQTYRGQGIGAALEERCVSLAMAKGCDRIQLHCNIQRIKAHRFYERAGYQESRKYYTKKLPKL